MSVAEGHFGETCWLMQVCQQGGRVDANWAVVREVRVRIIRLVIVVVVVVEREARIAD